MADFHRTFRVQAWNDHKPRNASDAWKPRFDRPFLMNGLSKIHWGTERRLAKMWSEAAQEALRRERLEWMRFEALRFDFLPVYRHQPGDTASAAPTEKWIVDGFVRSGLIPDDNRFHNAGQLSLPPVLANWTGMTVRIIAKPVHADHRPHIECGCRESMALMQRTNDMKSKRKRAK